MSEIDSHNRNRLRVFIDMSIKYIYTIVGWILGEDYNVTIILIKQLLAKKENYMRLSYDKLWKLLIDRKMSVATLRKEAEIAPNTMTRMRKEQEVTLSVLGRICEVLDVNFGDIIEYIPDNEGRIER